MTSQERTKSLKLIDGFCSALRTALFLTALTAADRRRLSGKWYRGTKQMAMHAAHLREQLHEYLGHVPYRGADIDEQRERVEVQEQVCVRLERLLKEAKDSLLRERARLYGMATGVLSSLEHVQKQPFQTLDARQAVQAGITLLREDFDQRNHKISQAKRDQGEKDKPCILAKAGSGLLQEAPHGEEHGG